MLTCKTDRSTDIICSLQQKMFGFFFLYFMLKCFLITVYERYKMERMDMHKSHNDLFKSYS